MPETTSLDEVEGAPHVTLFDADPRVVRLQLSAGERVPPHRHPEPTVLLFVDAGRLAVDLFRLVALSGTATGPGGFLSVLAAGIPLSAALLALCCWIAGPLAGTALVLDTQ